MLLVFLYINNFIKSALIIITTIAKKYSEAETIPDDSPKKYPANSAIIGSFALHGINGVKTAVIFFYLDFQ